MAPALTHAARHHIDKPMTTTDNSLPPEAHWRKALAEGRFLLQRDRKTGEAVFPPRLDFSGQDALDWFEASGRGTVYSVTVIEQRPPALAYNVVLVDLEEGPRMMATVEDMAAHDVRIGMAVQARVSQSEEGARLVFHPV